MLNAFKNHIWSNTNDLRFLIFKSFTLKALCFACIFTFNFYFFYFSCTLLSMFYVSLHTTLFSKPYTSNSLYLWNSFHKKRTLCSIKITQKGPLFGYSKTTSKLLIVMTYVRNGITQRSTRSLDEHVGILLFNLIRDIPFKHSICCWLLVGAH